MAEKPKTTQGEENLSGTSSETKSIVDTEDVTKKPNGEPSFEDDLQRIKAVEGINDGRVTLDEVVAPTKGGEAAIRQIENIDMSKLISAPMTAAVQANFEASKKMLECMKEIGMKGETLSVVTFAYSKNGRQIKMTVPLLTLVPISALTIKQMTYAFKVKVDSETTVNLVTGNERTVGYGNQPQEQGQKKTDKSGATDTPGGGDTTQGNGDKSQGKADANAATTVKNNTHIDSTFGVSYSSKKNSTATQNSKYSVETNIDVNLTIGPDSMPAGISKMLEVLNDAIDIYNPNGQLTLSDTTVTLSKEGYGSVQAVYYDTQGQCAPSKVTCKKEGDTGTAEKITVLNQGDSAQVLFKAPGRYIVTAEKLQASVIVTEYAVPVATPAENTGDGATPAKKDNKPEE